MTHIDAKQDGLFFHAQTLASLGEDIDNCFYKPVLEGRKPEVGEGRYIFLFKKELDAMSKIDTAYFEFFKKSNDGDEWWPKDVNRGLYKLVHNGHPYEYAIQVDGEKYVIDTEELVLVMQYAPAEINLDRPPKSPIQTEKVFQKELNFSSLDSIFDKPLIQVTVGEFIQILKSIK